MAFFCLGAAGSAVYISDLSERRASFVTLFFQKVATGTRVFRYDFIVIEGIRLLKLIIN